MEKKKTKKTNKKQIKVDIIDIVMIGIIILLGFYIIYLGIQIKNKSETKEEKEANIVIPVLEKNTTSAITLSMNEFKEGVEYVFKVRNYRNKTVAKENIKYTITIENKDLTDIGIYKNESTQNLAKEEQEFIIENNTFTKKEEQEDIYTVKLNSKKNLKKDSKVSIKVDS